MTKYKTKEELEQLQEKIGLLIDDSDSYIILIQNQTSEENNSVVGLIRGSSRSLLEMLHNTYFKEDQFKKFFDLFIEFLKHIEEVKYDRKTN